MKNFIKQLWNYDFAQQQKSHLSIIFLLVLLVGVGYAFVEILVVGHPGGIALNLSNFKELYQSHPNASPFFNQHFTSIWLGFAIFCLLFRYAVIVSSYILSKRKFEPNFISQNFLTYIFSFVVAFVFNVLFLLLLVKILQFLGVRIKEGVPLFEQCVLGYTNFVNAHFPTLINVRSYILAIVLTFILAELPNYFVHWLNHRSRFFWLVFHRCHHCPEYLNPIAAPPAYAFEFVMIIPKTLVAAIISKLIFAQPLIMEMSIIYLLGYCFEIFNHSCAHYNLAYNNFIIRNLSRIYGDRGVYHLVHHSAFEQDQNINFAGGPFNIWDRVFGSYRKPYEALPPLGLTNQPQIRLNPFRIIFSGITQLVYEWQHNKSWATRMQILFGNVYFMPPNTKDFLKTTKE